MTIEQLAADLYVTERLIRMLEALEQHGDRPPDELLELYDRRSVLLFLGMQWQAEHPVLPVKLT